MSSLTDVTLLDTHTHYRPAGWVVPPGTAPTAPPAQPAATPAALENLDALAEESAAAGIDARALSATVESLFGLELTPETAAINGVNEYLAEAIHGRAYPFLGLATVDAYSGDDGAEQARYAIEQLGLHGLVIDSTRYGRYLSAPEAWPTLELAAELGVPVLVHPFAAADAEQFIAAAGRNGNSIGRGLQNGLALLAALHAELPTRLPELRLIFTALGNGAVYFAREQIDGHRERTGAAPHVYFETTRFNAPLTRYLADILGADRIVIGSDWPGRRDASRAHVDATLTAAGFDAEEQEQIRAGTARRLFRLESGRDSGDRLSRTG